MSDLKRLGSNIRSLRMAYGETQEQLGEAIYVEKNTVSNYETGQREPNKEMLTAIAKHYIVSIEDLLHSDLTSIGKITVDKDAFWKNIDIILPIISSDKAMQNENFKSACEMHTTFYGQLHLNNLDGFDSVDECIDGYMSAIEDHDIRVEAAANFVALRYLLMMSLKMFPIVMKIRPAALRQVTARDEKARKEIENIDPSFETDAEDALNEIKNSEMEKRMPKMLTAIKRSKKWSDLADYYLALQYVWNLVDNDLDLGFNQRIGIEMMNAFVSVKNVYAARFLKCVFDSSKGASSQSVDDI